MFHFEINSFKNLSKREIEHITDRLAFQPMGDIVMDWCDYIQATALNQIEIFIIKIRKNNEFYGIGILTVILKLKLSDLLSAGLKSFFSFLNLKKWNPFTLDIGFLNIPLIHQPGVLIVSKDNTDEYAEIFSGIVGYFRKNKLGMDALCICSDPTSDMTDRLMDDGLIPKRFEERTTLDYPYKNFEEYYSTLSRGVRYDVRRGKQMLANFGGKIELCNDFKSISPEVNKLFQNTSDSKGGLNLIKIGESYFSEMARLKSGFPQLLLVRSPEKLVAFFQLFQSGKTLFIKYCGLDYDLSYKMWAYFNLYYAAMEYALERGLTLIDCGLTNNDFKEHKLRCRLISVTYWIDFYHPLFWPIKFLKRLR